MKNLFYTAFICFLLLFCACSQNNSKKEYGFSYDHNNVVSINPNDSTPYILELSFGSILIKSDSLSGKVSRNILSFINNAEQINQVALLALKSNNSIPLTLKIGESLDTTFNLRLKPIPIDSAKLNISGNCAQLISVSNKFANVESLKRWLFQNKQHLNEVEFQKFSGLVRAITIQDASKLSVLGEVPVVKNLPAYKVTGSIAGDYFGLLACSSENQIEKFVEECIAKDFNLVNSNLEDELQCYKIGNPNGFQVICLIAINKDWTYQAYPLGAIMIDNIPPIILNKTPINSDEDYDNLLKNYNLNLSNVVVNNGQYTILIPDKLPKIAGGVKINIGQFEGSMYALSIPFTATFSPDIKTIIIKEPQRENIVATIDLSDKSESHSFRATFRSLEYGDNYIPITFIDNNGNVASFNLKQGVSKVEDKSNNINIDNNVNVW